MSVIKINPAVLNDKRDATATAWNEGLRLWMQDNNFEPQFEFTPEQQTFFAKTAYSQDAAAMRKTIVARVATRDTSVPNPLPEQVSETMRLLQEVGASIGKFHKDAGVVKALAEDLGTRAPAPEQAPAEAPVTEGTEQMAQGAGDVQKKGLLDQVLDAEAAASANPPALAASKIRTVNEATLFIDHGDPAILPPRAGPKAPFFTSKNLIREDGSKKGTKGFAGKIIYKMDPKHGRNEVSQNSDAGDGRAVIPSLVPGLTPEEHVAKVNQETGRDYDKNAFGMAGTKAELFARERFNAGKPYFFQEGVDKEEPLHPGLLKMIQTKDPERNGTNRATDGGNVEESPTQPTLDLTKNNILLRSLTETEAPFVGGYMDSVSKSKPGVLTVGEGLTYITDDEGKQKPATIEWLSQFKNRDEMKAELDKQRTRYLIKMQRDLEPQLKQLDEPTQALVANVAFNRGTEKARKYADQIVGIKDPGERYKTALGILAEAGTARGKAKDTIALAKGRYKTLAALETPEDAAAYGKNWENAPLRETVTANREALADKLYTGSHSKWGWKNKPAEQAKLKAINLRFKA